MLPSSPSSTSPPATAPLQPAPQFDPAVLLRAQGLRLLLLDVDGVLTDAGLYFSASGESLKRFDSQDGHGIKLLQRAGFELAVVSGRDSEPLRTRLQGLGVQHLCLGVEHKLPAAEALLRKLGLGWAQTAVMGDDWPDLPLLCRCALAAVPANAHAEALQLAHYRCQHRGGHGAVREVCDLLLCASGHYAAFWREALA